MNRHLFDIIKKDIMKLGIIYIISLGLFKFAFFNEGHLIIIKSISALFWLFVIPGFSIMYYWHDKLNFTERLLIGVIMGIALLGILSYYTGVIGLHIRYHSFVIPLIILLGGVITLIVKNKKLDNPN